MSVRSPDSNLVTADQQRGVLMPFKTIHKCGFQRIALVRGLDYDCKLGGNFIGGLRLRRSCSASATSCYRC
jgi:hypothetical protein